MSATFEEWRESVDYTDARTDWLLEHADDFDDQFVVSDAAAAAFDDWHSRQVEEARQRHPSMRLRVVR